MGWRFALDIHYCLFLYIFSFLLWLLRWVHCETLLSLPMTDTFTTNGNQVSLLSMSVVIVLGKTHRISGCLQYHAWKWNKVWWKMKKKKKSNTTPGIRWSSTDVTTTSSRAIGSLWKSGRNPQFSTIYGCMYLLWWQIVLIKRYEMIRSG